MIDIHSHILPGLDDGAGSLEEAVGMVRMAGAAGTTDIVATPHASPQFAFDPEAVERRIGELQRAAGDCLPSRDRQGAVPVPRIHYGCEMHLTMDNIEDALRLPERYSMAHRGYLLVELSDMLVPKTVSQIFEQLTAAGLRPVVAHPERNPILQKRLCDMEAWVEQGCLFQVTADSLLGRFGKAARDIGHALMARGMVHFLASDGHDLKHRRPVMDEARRYVQETYGREAAERLFHVNPRELLAGAPLSGAAEPLRKKGWFSRW